MYVRKVKKGGKVYSYYYKSQRIGDKVKSIYVGKALEHDVRKPAKQYFEKDVKRDGVVNNLVEFDNLLNEINKLIINKDLNNAMFIYNKMFDVYNNMEINHEDKLKVFEKLNNVYNNLVELGKENKVNVES